MPTYHSGNPKFSTLSLALSHSSWFASLSQFITSSCSNPGLRMSCMPLHLLCMQASLTKSLTRLLFRHSAVCCVSSSVVVVEDSSVVVGSVVTIVSMVVWIVVVLSVVVVWIVVVFLVVLVVVFSVVVLSVVESCWLLLNTRIRIVEAIMPADSMKAASITVSGSSMFLFPLVAPLFSAGIFYVSVYTELLVLKSIVLTRKIRNPLQCCKGPPQ